MNRIRTPALLVFLLLLGGWFVRPVHAQSVTFTVNNANDYSDRNIGDGICDFSVNQGEQCTLRAAIEEANAASGASNNYRIYFDIPGGGPHTIQPSAPLPQLNRQVEISGLTQPGASCPVAGSPANLLINQWC